MGLQQRLERWQQALQRSVMVAFVGLLLWRALEEMVYRSHRVKRRATAWVTSAAHDAQHRQRDEVLDTGLSYVLRWLSRAH